MVVVNGHACRGEVGSVAQSRGSVLEKKAVVVPQSIKLVRNGQERGLIAGHAMRGYALKLHAVNAM